MSFRRVAIARLATTYPEWEVCDFGHVADGGVHFNLLQRRGTAPDPIAMAGMSDHLLDLAVRDFGASFSGEHGIGRANQHAYDHYTPVPIQQYSAAIAAVFARVSAAGVRFGPKVSVGVER
jgi:FAD/FMN-containing dehydrogenase